ncbi:MAG TPA: hypothetical protein VFN28_02000, partial [Amaricoccus sp.]|nr:hypothetical protein [Amaricoccus sp.]
SSYPAETRYGIVWTTLSGVANDAALADLGPPDLGPPDLGPPDLGPDEGWEPVRSLFVQAPVGAVLAALAAGDLGADAPARMVADNVAEVAIGPELRVLVAVQAMDGARTALHAVASGPRAGAERAALAKRLERLRGDIERSCEQA